MTANIITFPTQLERDEIEFARKGTSNYTRACDEASDLWDAAMGQRGGAEIAQRIVAFSRGIDHLSRYRPEVLGDIIMLTGGCRIELRAMPAVLSGLAGVAARG